jgi:hypothetical protein
LISTTLAADFLVGGSPAFARLFDRHGRELGSLERLEDEPIDIFRQRARDVAGESPGTTRVLLGGLGSSGVAVAADELPRQAVTLPDLPLHESQREAAALVEANRRICLVAGRRWGKSALLVSLTVDGVLAGKSIGVFAPTYRFLRPLLDAAALALAHLPGASINRTHNEIRLSGGGSVDYWSLDSTGRAARGRKYHRAWSTKPRTTPARPALAISRTPSKPRSRQRRSTTPERSCSRARPTGSTAPSGNVRRSPRRATRSSMRRPQ